MCKTSFFRNLGKLSHIICIFVVVNNVLFRDKKQVLLWMKVLKIRYLQSLRSADVVLFFFIGDFVQYGSRNAVNKALERLTRKGLMLRVARGIYCYPKIEKIY